ncbi:MAG: acetyl-CoA carboxylase biotin carboxyl carrier protein [Parvibaculaceae bacterium]
MPAKKKSPTHEPAASDDGELALIRTLAGILNDTGLTEIEFEKGGVRVKVGRSISVSHVSGPAFAHGPVQSLAPLAGAPAAEAPAAQSIPPDAVKSPMVGTVYRAPSPGSPNFIEVGSEVRAGQTLLIIEAMKTMNQIAAPRAGKITQILVENAQPVEYGEALVVIE